MLGVFGQRAQRRGVVRGDDEPVFQRAIDAVFCNQRAHQRLGFFASDSTDRAHGSRPASVPAPPDPCAGRYGFDRHCGPTRRSRWFPLPAAPRFAPARARCSAADRPVKPPPMTQTSAAHVARQPRAGARRARACGVIALGAERIHRVIARALCGARSSASVKA